MIKHNRQLGRLNAIFTNASQVRTKEMSSDIDTIRARKPRAFQLATAITTRMSDVLLAKHNLSIFAAAFAVNAFACLPLIFVNRPLLDDMGRSMVGYLDWAADGRPLASVLFYLINLGKPAVNLAPFGQILALAILAMACVSLAAAFRVRNPIQAAIGTLPLGANPYFLNNLSYQFDAPLMAAAVLCAVMAANTLTKAGGVRFSSSVLLIAALMLYQPAACTFLVIILFSIAIRSFHQENGFSFIFKKLGDLLAVSIVSVGFYILAVSFKLNAYAIENGSVWKLDEAVPGVWKNLSNYWWRLYEDWHTDFAVLAAGLVIATALGSLLVSGPSRGVSQRALAVICATGAILFVSRSFVAPAGFESTKATYISRPWSRSSRLQSAGAAGHQHWWRRTSRRVQRDLEIASLWSCVLSYCDCLRNSGRGRSPKGIRR